MNRKLLILLILILAACQSAASPTAPASQAAEIAVTVAPQPPKIGTGTLTVVVTHAGQPISGAQVDVRGNMNMAGMAPILGSGKSDAQGEISLPFKWSMGGDWTVTVMATLADKSQVSQDFNVTVNP